MIAARAIVTDVEGTTSAIGFVKDVLFPYADGHLDAYVAQHRNEPAVAEALRLVGTETGGEDATDERLLAHLHAWIAADRKTTPLKTLQGLIWAEGYAGGELLGHVYPDVPPALRSWRARNFALYVYSSGSIEAQRALFAHSCAGDLTALFSGNFDTTTGPKREAGSYTRIAGAIGFAPDAVLFLSDTEEELDAARAAGLQTARLLRPADTPVPAATGHPSYVDFATLSLDVGWA